jgi:hypothetical protein
MITWDKHPDIVTRKRTSKLGICNRCDSFSSLFTSGDGYYLCRECYRDIIGSIFDTELNEKINKMRKERELNAREFDFINRRKRGLCPLVLRW